jgi:phosphoglycolate phosphatase
MYKYFIFDLDGTLVNTLSDLKNAMNRMLRELSFPEVDEAGVLKAINHGVVEFVKGCLPEDVRNDEELLNKALEIYQGYYTKGYLINTAPYPCIPEALEYLKSKGVKMAVFSNKQDDMTRAICDKLFPGVFDTVLGGRTGRFHHKPSPEGALYIADVLGADPDEIAFVGDSDVDMHTAKNAGMHPIGVSWGFRPAELLTELGAETIICGIDGFKELA